MATDGDGGNEDTVSPRSHPSVWEGREEGNVHGMVAIGVGQNREGGHGLTRKSFTGSVVPREGCVVDGRHSGWLTGASAAMARGEGAPN